MACGEAGREKMACDSGGGIVRDAGGDFGVCLGCVAGREWCDEEEEEESAGGPPLSKEGFQALLGVWDLGVCIRDGIG